MQSNNYKSCKKSKTLIIDSRCRNIGNSSSKYKLKLQYPIKNVSEVHLTGLRVFSDEYSSNISNSKNSIGIPIDNYKDSSGYVYAEDFRVTIADKTCKFDRVGINPIFLTEGTKEFTKTIKKKCNGKCIEETVTEVKNIWKTTNDYYYIIINKELDSNSNYELKTDTNTGSVVVGDDPVGKVETNNGVSSIRLKQVPALIHLKYENSDNEIIWVDVVVHKISCGCNNLTYHCLKNKNDYDYYILRIPEVGGSIISNCDPVSNGFSIIPRFHPHDNGDWTPDPQTLGNIISGHECSPPILLDKMSIEWVDFKDDYVDVPDHVLVFKIIYNTEEVNQLNNR